ncbi:unnamed protein product [Rotaria sordida]|uniref:Uncharacterized protein n=1 Tax=Rotaria sordida TaxID=392033 RepID=A0A819Y234_9BILA|nr:unnamed protein product [Rotaria sordida]CAF1196347.1 unnamed protein product [Rotaria sordida]CAF4151509.1 unnamed protein product [Rotaria sordida]
MERHLVPLKRGRLREKDKNTSPSSSGNQQREQSPSPANQMQRQVQCGYSPRTVDRVDQAYPTRGDPQDHIHFKDGRHVLNQDGTWKHDGRSLSREEKKWITENNWTLPKQDEKKK